MSSFNARREEDLNKLRELERQTNGRIAVVRTSGNPVNEVSLRFNVRTAVDSSFPSKDLREVSAVVQLPSRYPFEPPVITISNKVFNPNVFSSGRVCLGGKWMPTEFLDLLAQRVFKILAFDESIVNVASPANSDAARWYVKAKQSLPQHFPSDSLLTNPKPSSSMKWVNHPSAPVEKVIRACPKCATKLRLSAGKSGEVTCPSCAHTFMVTT
jgi:ubiquitin-protein ligase